MPRERINAKTKMGDPWITLSNAIKDTLQKKETDLRLSMIHKACTTLVTKEKYDLIFNGLSDLLRQHFEEWHKQLLASAGDPLLTILTDQYESFKDYCLIFPKFYMSYDRHFKKETEKKYGETSKTLMQIRRLFISTILSDLKLFEDAATPSILKVISYAQNGSDVDLSKVSTLIEMYYSFRKKGDKPEIFLDFKDKLEAQENDFYNQFFENNFKSHSFPDYLSITSKQFLLDKRIAEEIFEPSEVFDFLSRFHIALLSSKEDKFLGGSEPPIAEALLANDLRPLKWLVEVYQQFSVDLSPVYEACAGYIKNQMLKKAQDFPEIKKEDKNKQKNDKESSEPKVKAPEINIFAVVGQLMDLTLKLKTPYSMIFRSKEAEKALNDSIKLAWNNDRFNIVLSFNDYIDTLVRDEFKSSERPQEEQTKIISQFYGYLSDKAKFNTFYESAYVRRLIKMRTKSSQYDVPIINAIRKISPDFMIHLDDYNKQFNASEQLKNDFKTYVAEDSSNQKMVTVEPFVFNYLLFPLSKDEQRNIPATASDANNKFKSFYTEKHKQSILVLMASGSSVEFSLKILSKNRPSKTYTISTDLSCGCVLFAVSQRPYKYKEIRQLLNEDELAPKIVLRLVKYRLLSRKGETTKLSDDDEFSLNTSFQNPTTKLVIPSVISEKKEANKISASKDEIEKKEAINAAIVRVLKQSQKLKIEELVSTVIGILQNRFECTSEMVRRGITQCEGNNYIKRGIEDEQIIITYIA